MTLEEWGPSLLVRLAIAFPLRRLSSPLLVFIEQHNELIFCIELVLNGTDQAYGRVAELFTSTMHLNGDEISPAPSPHAALFNVALVCFMPCLFWFDPNTTHHTSVQTLAWL